VETEHLLRALADGETHSGEDLARAFGVTLAAVWKHVAKLDRWGLAVTEMPGLLYRLERPLDLLDADAVRSRVRAATAARLGRIEVFTELGSTNGRLLERGPPPLGKFDVCIAEYQSEGRGRRGRRWNAPLGGGLCLSAGWQYAATPPELGALGLAIGVVARRAIERAAGLQIALKWPNDLVWDDRKLGGILVELAHRARGGCGIVAGIGVNVALPPDRLAVLSDWPRGAVDLASATAGAAPARTALAAELIDGIAELFASYELHGFAPYRAEWAAADCLRGRRVSIEMEPPIVGTALGVGADGALLVETLPGVRQRVLAGDVSVRSTR
jgi:BirA family biotin operon repressor/biotin-[acetyl-CoA-carboxylase] ligase